MPKNLQKTYVAGGIQGGRTAQYLAVASILSQRIDQDYRKEIIAEWHDESHWNWFTAKHPVTVLDAGYCYPEEKTIPFEKRVIALNKDRKIYR